LCRFAHWRPRSYQILLRHAYSKPAEDEADKFAYELLVNSRYDPQGAGKSFGSLLQYLSGVGTHPPQHTHPIRDYFLSHPPLDIRKAEFSERAAAWWKRHPNERQYVGQQNLFDRKALNTLDMSGE
jgi:predicted Zn-dependent protease